MDHHQHHSKNAFCGNAGPEELKHLQSLLDGLSNKEIEQLIDAIEIDFGKPLSEIDRDALQSVVDEADREIFYRQYHKLLEDRA